MYNERDSNDPLVETLPNNSAFSQPSASLTPDHFVNSSGNMPETFEKLQQPVSEKMNDDVKTNELNETLPDISDLYQGNTTNYLPHGPSLEHHQLSSPHSIDFLEKPWPDPEDKFDSDEDSDEPRSKKCKLELLSNSMDCKVNGLMFI